MEIGKFRILSSGATIFIGKRVDDIEVKYVFVGLSSKPFEYFYTNYDCMGLLSITAFFLKIGKYTDYEVV